MGLFAIPLVIILYWLIDKYQENKGNKDYQKYQEDKKRRGLL